jgi:hypothetical protein
MKRFLSVTLTVILALSLIACGKKNTTDAVSLGKELMEQASGFPEMKTITSSDKDAEINFSTLCDFDYSKVSSYYYAYAADGTAPEIAVVSLKNTDDIADLMSAIKDHQKTREGTMQEYSSDQVQMVQSYILVQKNGTVGYFIGQGTADLEKTFKEEVK